MDPSRNICQISNSFAKHEESSTISQKPIYYINDFNTSSSSSSYTKIPGSPRTRRNEMKTDAYQLKFSQNENHLLKSREDILLPKEIANPFKTYAASSKIFSKSATILANIDAVYNFTGQVKGYIDPQNTKDFDTVFLDSKIGYINYIQYRLPASRIFSPCINFEINSLKNKPLDKRNIFSKCGTQNIVEYVLNIVQGVDLVVASNRDFKNNLIKALKLCKPGGSFVCRIDDKQDNLQDIYMAACNFEKISLFKPMSESLNTSYTYLIATNFLGNSIDWISMIDTSSQLKIPDSFIKYVENYYDSLEYLKKQLLNSPISYNLYKCKAIWNIF